jgi:hypothetical protein
LIKDKNILQGYLDGVVSCAYTDIIVNVLTCIFNGLDFENKTDPHFRLIRIIVCSLKALNNILKQSSTSFFYDQTEPTIADYFAFEAFAVARDYHKKVIPNDEDCQVLGKLEQIMKQRPGLANYLNKGLLFKRFTGSPKEHDYLTKLAELKN